MKTNLHLAFPGTCREAFSFYEKTFGSKILTTMTWGEAPEEISTPPGSRDLVMHTAMPLGNITLMGADTPGGPHQTLAGFDISVDFEEEAEVRRVFAALSEGGHVQMPLAKTFWSPLFGMARDRFGVSWMVSLPGPH